MRDSSLVALAPKSKVTARKWMSTVCGKDAIAKEKLDYLTTFVPHDLPAKIECIEDLEKNWYKN